MKPGEAGNWKGAELEGYLNSGGHMVLLLQLENPFTTATPSLRIAIAIRKVTNTQP